MNEKAKAEACAKRIKEYWAEKGHKVKVRLVSCRSDGRDTFWNVESDMINGLPRSLYRGR